MFHFRLAKRTRPLSNLSANVAALTIFSFVAACGAKKDSAAPNPAAQNPANTEPNKANADAIPAASAALGAFLKWSDFDAYSLPQGTQTDAENILSTLSWESTFYANFPEQKYSDAPADSDLTPQEKAAALAEKKCREDLEAKGTKIEIDKDTIKVTLKIKNTCIADDQSTLESVASLQCVGSDLSSLKGKTLKELDPILKDAEKPTGICGKATEFKFLSNYKSESEYKFNHYTSTSYSTNNDSNQLSSQVVDQAVTTANQGTGRSTTLSATMRPDGSPCAYKRKDNTIVLDGECWDQFASRSTSEYAPQSGLKSDTQVERTSYKAKGIVEETGSKDVWHKTGTYEVTVNEWKGTVTLSSKGAPRAVLTSPSGAKIDQLIAVAGTQEVMSNKGATYEPSSSGESDAYSNQSNK